MKPALIAAVLFLAGCSETAAEPPKTIHNFYGMNEREFFACEALLNGGLVFGSDPGARQVLAQQVNTWAQDTGLSEVGDRLVASVGSTEEWSTAADGFGRRCVELGWPTQ